MAARVFYGKGRFNHKDTKTQREDEEKNVR